MSEISCSSLSQNMVPHPWQVGNVVFMCLQNYWVLPLCPPESTEPYSLSLQCRKATNRYSSGGKWQCQGSPQLRTCRVPKKSNKREGVGGMEGWTQWLFFLLHFSLPKKKKKKIHLNRLLEVTASGSFPKKVNTTHCSGPITILLLHPSGSLQIAKIRWAQE